MAKWLKVKSSRAGNHYIARVIDTRNGNREVISRYFDGTQAQALAHFRALPELQQRRRAGYQIIVSANALVLFDGYGEVTQ